jgi:hypothetical protein
MKRQAAPNHRKRKSKTKQNSFCWVLRGWGKREWAEWVVREGVGAGRRNDPSLVCTYE